MNLCVKTRMVLIVVCGLVTFGSLPRAGAATTAQNAARDDANVAEQYLQAAADHERAALNLPPLRRDPALVQAARAHALQMVEHNSISHQYAREPDLAARGAAAGAKFSMISENVAQAASAVRIHTAWMNSEGHRHNLLDPNVDSVGIAVFARGSQLFAVEDFERSVEAMSLGRQESIVANAVASLGIAIDKTDDSARQVCMGRDTAQGMRQPTFVMRYTTADLSKLPEKLRSRLATGRYGGAVVAACAKEDGEEFAMYRIAVMLYPA